MDLHMPEINGLHAMSAIRGQFPDARIIVLTTYGGDVQGSARPESRCPGLPTKDSLA
jgi:DNA-binding NarL/FixJ family response regulator